MSLVLPLGSGVSGEGGAAGGDGGLRDPGWIPLMVGLGVRDALSELIGEPADATGQRAKVVLKWPNDVLVIGARATSAPGAAGGGEAGDAGDAGVAGDTGDAGDVPAKISGILCQLLAADDLVVAGIGVNVTVPIEVLPVPVGTAAPATSLHLCGAPREITREDVVTAVSLNVERRHAAWLAGGEAAAGLRREYREACVTVGSLIDVHLPGDEVRRARATGISDEGELEIVDDAGRASTVRAGDVVHIRPRLGA